MNVAAVRWTPCSGAKLPVMIERAPHEPWQCSRTGSLDTNTRKRSSQACKTRVTASRTKQQARSFYASPTGDLDSDTPLSLLCEESCDACSHLSASTDPSLSLSDALWTSLHQTRKHRACAGMSLCDELRRTELTRCNARSHRQPLAVKLTRLMIP